MMGLVENRRKKTTNQYAEDKSFQFDLKEDRKEARTPLASGIKLRSSCFPPLNTVQHGGRTEVNLGDPN